MPPLPEGPGTAAFGGYERLRLAQVNDRWLERLGDTSDEVLNCPITSFMTDELARRYTEIVLSAFLRGEVIENLELHFLTKQGETLEVMFSARANPGKVKGYLSHNRSFARPGATAARGTTFLYAG